VNEVTPGKHSKAVAVAAAAAAVARNRWRRGTTVDKETEVEERIPRRVRAVRLRLGSM